MKKSGHRKTTQTKRNKGCKKNSFFSRISDPAITKPYSIKIIEFTVKKKPSIEHFDIKKNIQNNEPNFHALLPHFF